MADFIAEIGDQKGAVFAGSFLSRLLRPLYLAAAALTLWHRHPQLLLATFANAT
jgi:hypothetical protein